MLFQKQLLEWYHQHKRNLPWRESHAAYRIWLSEIMLQQTQVVTVIDYFNRFIEVYPTVFDLAKADEDQVLKLWEGLGYYSRARRLIPCARMVVEAFGGEFPSAYNEMIKLPGVGSYTAGAILSIAYNKKVPAVDGNVMRVYSRLYNLNWDISHGQTKKKFEAKVFETLPGDRRHFNQALMELGARVCTPKKPLCNQCPIQTWCLAYELNTYDQLPVKTKKIKKKRSNKAVLYITHEDKILLIKKPGQGLLAGMWGFLTIDDGQTLADDIEYELANELGLDYLNHQAISQGKHVFTHLIWDMVLYRVVVLDKCHIDYPECVWISEDEFEKYPIATAYKKLLK